MEDNEEQDKLHRIYLRSSPVTRQYFPQPKKVMESGRLPVYAIYYNYPAFPGFYIAKRFVEKSFGIDRAWEMQCKNIDGIRDHLKETGLTCFPRYENDDPKIVETWL